MAVPQKYQQFYKQLEQCSASSAARIESGEPAEEVFKELLDTMTLELSQMTAWDQKGSKPKGRFYCQMPDCDRSYQNIASLRQHTLLHMPGPKPFKCTYETCAFTTNYQSSILVHIRSQHFRLPSQMTREQTRVWNPLCHRYIHRTRDVLNENDDQVEEEQEEKEESSDTSESDSDSDMDE